MKQMQTDGRSLLLLPCAQKRLNGFQFLELVVAYRNVHSLTPPFSAEFFSQQHSSINCGGFPAAVCISYRKKLHFVPPAPKRRDAVLYSKRKELDT